MEVISKIENTPHAGVFIFLWSFIFGIFVSSFINFLPIYILTSLVFCLIIFLISFFVSRDQKVSLFLLISVFSFSLGAMRYSIKDFYLEDLVLKNSIGSSIEIKGIIVSEPEQRENDIRFVLKTETSKVLVSSPFIRNINYGDEVIVKGKLERPGIIESETGRNFDYARYLSKDDIYYTMSFGNVSLLSNGNGNAVRAFLLNIKHSFTNKINELLPEPESSLLAGLIISGKQALPKSVLEEFKQAGVVHIVVLSGYNITIVADFLRNSFSYLSFSLANSASVVGIVLFVLMAGFTSTVVRAAIIVLIVILGKSLRRNFSTGRALLVAAFLMLLENPKILVYDPSFQLSFLAVFALVYVSPIVEKYLRGVTPRAGFRQILSTTVATQIVVFPYLLYSMGSVSIISLVSNILILVFIPFTMLIGFVSVIFGFINYYLALPFAYVAHLLLSYILSVAHSLGTLSFASIKISHFPLWLTLLIYLIFGMIIWRSKNSLQHFASSDS